MRSGFTPQVRYTGRSHPGYFFRAVLPVFFLLAAVAGQALAASGSTRLTIHLDQSVVDAIARWKGEQTRPPATPSVSVAEGVLLHLVPAMRAGLVETHHPLWVEQILKGLQQDALLVFDGQARHAGSTGGSCVSGTASDGGLTVHSI